VIRVALAEDNLLVREGIRNILAAEPEIEIVAVCDDRDGLLEAVERTDPDVVLTDIRMPPAFEDEGIQIANRLRGTHPAIGVIVLSQYSEPALVLSVLEGGSARRGYLLKDTLVAGEQLVAGTKDVAAGGSAIDPKVVDTLVEARAADAPSPLHRLTPREREILAEMATGKSNSAIAEKLVITKRAVERHITSIFSKLELPDESAVSRRVTATLLFLAQPHGEAGPRPF
jgi:DNA-binding NarL/FixJ family response regulator